MTHRSEKTIDVSVVRQRLELHDLLARELGFRVWYGRNWDAFCDCVRDPMLSTLPSRLRIIGVAELRTHLSREADLLLNCLHYLKQDRPEVEIVTE